MAIVIIPNQNLHLCGQRYLELSILLKIGKLRKKYFLENLQIFRQRGNKSNYKLRKWLKLMFPFSMNFFSRVLYRQFSKLNYSRERRHRFEYYFFEPQPVCGFKMQQKMQRCARLNGFMVWEGCSTNQSWQSHLMPFSKSSTLIP